MQDPAWMNNLVLPIVAALVVAFVTGVGGAACWAFREGIKQLHTGNHAFLKYLEEENARGREERADQRRVLEEHTAISKDMYRTMQAMADVVKAMNDDLRRVAPGSR